MIKVAIADDHTLFREGMRYLISQMVDVSVSFEAASGNEVIAKLPDIETDIILLDLRLKGMDGIELLQYLREKYPKLGIIVMAYHVDPKMIKYLLERGANSVLLKDIDGRELHQAIETVYREGRFVTPLMHSVKEMSIMSKGGTKPKSEHDITLSAREIEVLKLICQQTIEKAQSEAAGMDHNEVEKHRKLLYEKFTAISHYSDEVG